VSPRATEPRGGDDLAERARRWVEESTKAQGLPVTISDPATIRRVAEILREGRERNRRQT
jgi:hypothetical protein